MRGAILLVLLLVPSVMACGENITVMVVTDVGLASKDFSFLGYSGEEQEYGMSEDGYYLAWGYYQTFDIYSDANMLSVDINGERVFHGALSGQGRNYRYITDDGTEDIMKYNFPSVPIVYDEDDIISYNGQVLTIYLDDRPVREYTLSYRERPGFPCPVHQERTAPVTFIVVLILVLLALALLVSHWKK